MVSREILNSHPVAHLRKEISKTNIKGASKMKKAEVIDVMMKHQSRFSHITMRGKTEKKAPPKKAPPTQSKTAEEKKRDKMNKMDPAELFSKLPKELHRNIGGTALAKKKKGGADLLKKKMTKYLISKSSPIETKFGDLYFKNFTKKNVILTYHEGGTKRRIETYENLYDMMYPKEKKGVRDAEWDDKYDKVEYWKHLK